MKSMETDSLAMEPEPSVTDNLLSAMKFQRAIYEAKIAMFQDAAKHIAEYREKLAELDKIEAAVKALKKQQLN